MHFVIAFHFDSALFFPTVFPSEPERMRRRERNPEDVYQTMPIQGISSKIQPHDFTATAQLVTEYGTRADQVLQPTLVVRSASPERR